MAKGEALHALRPFLRNWVWEHGRVGTRYLDCSTGEIRFDEGKKAHFASETHIYVSLVKDADPAAHDGPALHEGRSGPIAARRAAGAPLPTRALWPRKCSARSRTVSSWPWSARTSATPSKPRRVTPQEPMFDDEIRAAVIEDVRRIWVGVREQLALYDYTILPRFSAGHS